MSPEPFDSRAEAPPAKRWEKGYGDENGPRAETRGILVPRVFALIFLTDQESKGSGLENELRGTKILYFSQGGNYPVRVRKL